MKNIFCTLFVMCFTTILAAQKQSGTDESKLLKMTPSESEAYKQKMIKEAASRRTDRIFRRQPICTDLCYK